MLNKTKFYICPHCRNTAEMIYDTGIKLHCCGDEMNQLLPNTVEASGEKHIPEVLVRGEIVEVNVGSVNHPMVAEHYIEWVYVETENGGYRKDLRPDSAPHVEFELGEDKAVAVYAYCNLHGLWMTSL
jgi:superoxide reductase